MSEYDQREESYKARKAREQVPLPKPKRKPSLRNQVNALLAQHGLAKLMTAVEQCAKDRLISYIITDA